MNQSNIRVSVADKDKQLLESITRILAKHLHPRRIFLFGSRVKDQAPLHADFDLAVDMERVDVGTHRRIMEELDTVVGLYGVDIVYLQSVDEEFREIVLETGKIVYEQGT